MLHCSESMMRRLNIAFFLKNSYVFFQCSCDSSSRVLLLSLLLLNLIFFRFLVETARALTAKTHHFPPTKLFLKNPGSCLWCLICSMLQVLRMRLLDQMAENLLPKSCFLILIQASSFLDFIQSPSNCTGRAKSKESVSISISSKEMKSQKLSKKLRYSSSLRNLAY